MCKRFEILHPQPTCGIHVYSFLVRTSSVVYLTCDISFWWEPDCCDVSPSVINAFIPGEEFVMQNFISVRGEPIIDKFKRGLTRSSFYCARYVENRIFQHVCRRLHDAFKRDRYLSRWNDCELCSLTFPFSHNYDILQIYFWLDQAKLCYDPFSSSQYGCTGTCMQMRRHWKSKT